MSLSGKLAHYDLKCSPQPNSDTNGVSYYYGYVHKSRPKRQLFAYRDKCRNLSVKPYTDDELSKKELFADCVHLTISFLQDISIKNRLNVFYKRQNKYISLYTYILGSLLLNNGNAPDDWQL